MKTKILFVANDQRLQPIIHEMVESGRYEVRCVSADTALYGVQRCWPQILFLDGQSLTHNEFVGCVGSFSPRGHNPNFRMLVLDPSEDQAEVLIGPEFVSAPHTLERLIASIEGTWGHARDQPFSLEFTWSEKEGRSVCYHVKERRLRRSFWVDKELESERYGLPTAGQWEKILHTFHAAKIDSLPSELGEPMQLLKPPAPWYFVRLATFDKFAESYGTLVGAPPEYAEKLQRLHRTLETVMNAARSIDRETRISPADFPPELPVVFRFNISKPTGCYALRGIAGKFTYYSAPGRGTPWSSRPVKPGVERWSTFWREIEALDFWNWRRSYQLETGTPVVDNGTWGLVIQHGAKASRIMGFHAYPADADPALAGPRSSRRFERFLDALRTLLQDDFQGAWRRHE